MVAFDTAKRRTSIEIQSIATSQCTQTLPRSLPLRPRRISRSLSPSQDDLLRRQYSETIFATVAIKPIFPTARRTACVKLLQLDWRNVARRHEIMAITGHQSLEEVERYTRAARKAQLADSAMSKLKR